MGQFNDYDDNLRNQQAIAASATGAGGAQVAATLPATVNLTNKLRHFTVTAREVGSVVGGLVTVSGVAGGPLNYQFVDTVSAGGWIDVDFDPPLPATGPNVAITVTLPAIVGGGAGAVTVSGWQS
jgi:hypothetical protein